MRKSFNLVTLTLLFFLSLKHCSAHSLQKRKADPLLDIPGKIRPFCTGIVGTIESAPHICSNVADFIIDATVSACQESLAEILRICTNSNCLRDVAQRICPVRETIERRIKRHIDSYCESKLQRFVDPSGRFISNVGTVRICNEFIEAVRETCRYTVAGCCEDIRFPYEFPCRTYLPGIICD